jgi:hypothetical protein
MKRPVPLYPIFLAAYPVLFLYARNKQIVDIREAVVPETIALTLLAATWGLAWAVLRNVDRSALVASFCVFFVQSFGPFQSLTWNPLFLYLPAFALGGFLAVMSPPPSANMTRGLNLAALVLLAFPLTTILWSEAAHTLLPKGSSDHSPVAPSSLAQASKGRGTDPNIYDFLLDGYAREDVLRTLYGCDNSPFLSALRAQGFTVAKEARTNYWQTTLSLASMLNASYVSYVNGMPGYLECGWGDRRSLSQLVQKNFVMDYLKRRGYHTMAFATGYGFNELVTADVFKTVQVSSLDGLSSFQYEALSMTPIPEIAHRLNPVAPHSSQVRRDRILNALDHCTDLSDRAAPLFVLAHVMAPHPPFVFHADGSPASPAKPFSGADGSAYIKLGGSVETYRSGYAEQVQFVNRKMLEAVGRVLKRSTRPSVIILHGDHGPGSGLDWDVPERSDFYERMSILLAVRMPEGEDPGLPEDLTLVNLYRVLFSRLFGENLPLLPNASYYHQGERTIEISPAALQR